jgi:hypothetical protein
MESQLQDADNLFCKGMDYAVVNLDTVALTLDDPFVFQEGQMPGDSGLRETQAFPYMLYIAFLGAESGNYLETYRMPQYFQYFGIIIKIPSFVEFLRFHIRPHCIEIENYIYV